MLQAALFVRPLSRVLTNHADIQLQFDRSLLVRILGEIVSLLALVSVAQTTHGTQPLAPILAVVFAFLLPTLLFRDTHVDRILGLMRMPNTPLNHMLTGSVAIVLLYALFELSVRATTPASRDRTPPEPRDPAPAAATGMDIAVLAGHPFGEP